MDGLGLDGLLLRRAHCPSRKPVETIASIHDKRRSKNPTERAQRWKWRWQLAKRPSTPNLIESHAIVVRSKGEGGLTNQNSE